MAKYPTQDESLASAAEDFANVLAKNSDYSVEKVSNFTDLLTKNLISIAKKTSKDRITFEMTAEKPCEILETVAKTMNIRLPDIKGKYIANIFLGKSPQKYISRVGVIY